MPSGPGYMPHMPKRSDRIHETRERQKTLSQERRRMKFVRQFGRTEANKDRNVYRSSGGKYRSPEEMIEAGKRKRRRKAA